MKQYEWMVTYTPQTEWIAGRGILLWLAFFFIELGAGMFFILFWKKPCKANKNKALGYTNHKKKAR